MITLLAGAPASIPGSSTKNDEADREGDMTHAV
jgi:hypothetical protein